MYRYHCVPLKALHNEELYDLYFPPHNIWAINSRTMSWAGHVARMGGRRGAYRVLVGRSEGKRPLSLKTWGWMGK